MLASLGMSRAHCAVHSEIAARFTCLRPCRKRVDWNRVEQEVAREESAENPEGMDVRWRRPMVCVCDGRER